MVDTIFGFCSQWAANCHVGLTEVDSTDRELISAPRYRHNLCNLCVWWRSWRVTVTRGRTIRMLTPPASITSGIMSTSFSSSWRLSASETFLQSRRSENCFSSSTFFSAWLAGHKFQYSTTIYLVNVKITGSYPKSTWRSMENKPATFIHLYINRFIFFFHFSFPYLLVLSVLCSCNLAFSVLLSLNVTK